MRVDVHQHVWTEPLVEALAGRETLPFIRHAGGSTMLHASGERPYAIDLDGESRARRTRLLADDGVDLAMVAISSPIGIEVLPRERATELIDAHLRGVGELGERFAAWGPIALQGAGGADVDALRSRGCPGISLPAGALARPDALNALAPVLERAERLRMPLFVHPGGAFDAREREAPASEPAWWRALTDYVSQMHAAWLAFVTQVGVAFRELVVVFAMLAGGAPLLSERLSTRGGPEVSLRDPRIFYESSSYGPFAVEAMERLVGATQLVHGSDRSVAEPVRNGRERRLQTNSARLLAIARAAA